MDALYNQYLAFSASKSPFIRHRAIEGMGNLFIRYPQFLLKPQTSSIIKNALASEDWQMRLQMITNLTDFLIAEEAKMVKQGKPGTAFFPFYIMLVANILHRREETGRRRGRIGW